MTAAPYATCRRKRDRIEGVVESIDRDKGLVSVRLADGWTAICSAARFAEDFEPVRCCPACGRRDGG